MIHRQQELKQNINKLIVILIPKCVRRVNMAHEYIKVNKISSSVSLLVILSIKLTNRKHIGEPN